MKVKKIELGSPSAIPSHLIGKTMFMSIFRAREKSWDSKYTYVSGLAEGIQIDLRNKNVRIIEGKFGDFTEDAITKKISCRFTPSIRTFPEGYYTCITVFLESGSVDLGSLDEIIKRGKSVSDSIAGMIAIMIDAGLIEEKVWEGIGHLDEESKYQVVCCQKPPRGHIQVKTHDYSSFKILEPFAKLTIQKNLPKQLELALRWYQRAAEMDTDTDRFVSHYLSIIALVDSYFSRKRGVKETKNSTQRGRFEYYVKNLFVLFIFPTPF